MTFFTDQEVTDKTLMSMTTANVEFLLKKVGPIVDFERERGIWLKNPKVGDSQKYLIANLRPPAKYLFCQQNIHKMPKYKMAVK